MPQNLVFRFDEATCIVVTDPRNYPFYQVKDPATIQAIVALLAEQNTGWGVPAGGIPVARYRLNFYDDKKFLGNIGLDTTFLTAHVQGNFWSRPIDLATYNRLQTLAEAMAQSVVHRNSQEE